MQTFLPEPTFAASAQALDDKRLGKQRVEVLQLLTALSRGPRSLKDPSDPTSMRTTPWYNHPACRMWRGRERELIVYGALICDEWMKRGFKDTCMAKIRAFTKLFPSGPLLNHPPWFDDDFIRAHRSNLIRKNPAFYQPQWPNVPPNLPYIWPV